MLRYKNILVIASVLLAVLAPLTIAMKAEMDFKNAEIIKVEIEPYDPRHPLYGHYLQFRVKWDWKGGKANQEVCTASQSSMPFDAGCCLCVEGDAENPKASLAKCDNVPKQCKYVVPSKNYYGGEDFPIGIDQFFVDERFAMPLENLFRAKKEKFTVGLAMRKRGNPLLEKLYVGGLELSDYIAKHGGSIPEIKPEEVPEEPIPFN